ncbi:RING finger protein 151 [Brachyhypopomus gauderio]|uniref:RING finger protein 151 n=1 Tax=Brachyhypopomus gauderio TaxID=698409 RepID=UPI00404343CB
MSDDYEVELFVKTPDPDLICIICRGVLRCPVRVACSHVFCKKCILQWMRRQETCPCCREPISPSLMFVMLKLSKSISHLHIKCRNEQQGCTATFPLSDQHLHSSTCPYECVQCPRDGCGKRMLRRDAWAHMQTCGGRTQSGPAGRGDPPGRHNQDRARRESYRELRSCEAQKRTQRPLATALRRNGPRMRGVVEYVSHESGLNRHKQETGRRQGRWEATPARAPALEQRGAEL